MTVASGLFFNASRAAARFFSWAGTCTSNDPLSTRAGTVTRAKVGAGSYAKGNSAPKVLYRHW